MSIIKGVTYYEPQAHQTNLYITTISNLQKRERVQSNRHEVTTYTCKNQVRAVTSIHSCTRNPGELGNFFS